MEILYLSNSRLPSRAANSIHTMRMAQALAQLGHSVTLVARRGDDSTQAVEDFYGVTAPFQIELLAVPDNRSASVVYSAKAARLLKSARRTDLVLGRSAQGVLAALWLGFPCVYEVHAPPESWARRWLEVQILRSPRLLRLVLITDALRSEYFRLFPWLERGEVSWLVAHDACDPPSGFVPSTLAQRNWPGRPNAPQIGYVGHLYQGKGVEVVVQLAERMPEVDFHLVGGTESDIAGWKQRTQLANIIFHGFVSPAEIFRFHARLDILLLPAQRRVAVHGGSGDISRWMSPLKLFEYMATGKPIIASALPVLQEILRDGDNCLLAAPDEIDAWVIAVQRLLADHALAARLGATAHMEWQAMYTWQRRAERIVAGLLVAKET